MDFMYNGSMKMMLVLLLIFSFSAMADSVVPAKRKHIKGPKEVKTYGYQFSQSKIGTALEHLLSHSTGSLYNGKTSEYKKQIKIIKSNPSAAFLELRLFYAHLEDQDQSEKEFVVHLMRQLNHKQSQDFISSLKVKKSRL